MPQNKQSHRKTGRLADVVSLILGIVLVFALLQVFGSLKGDRLVFPGVGEILKAFGRLLISGHTYLLIGTTLRHLMLALLFSTVIGVGIGLLEGMFDVVWHLFRPLMILLRSIPMIVLIVIIMVLTKYERVPVIATTLVLVPLISEATNEGCRGIDQDLIDVYRMNSSFNMRVLMQVYLPLMTGYLRQAYTSAVGMGIKLAVSTEYLVQTRNSLGKAVFSSSYFNEYADIFAYALIMILLVLLVSELPPILGRRIARRRVMRQTQ